MNDPELFRFQDIQSALQACFQPSNLLVKMMVPCLESLVFIFQNFYPVCNFLGFHTSEFSLRLGQSRMGQVAQTFAIGVIGQLNDSHPRIAFTAHLMVF